MNTDGYHCLISFQVRRTVSVDSAKPVAKKPRLEKSNSAVPRRNSIFDLFWHCWSPVCVGGDAWL